MKDDVLVPLAWVDASIGDTVASDGLFTDGDWVETKDQDPNGSVRLIQLADIGEGTFLDKSARFLTRTQAHALNCRFLTKGDLLVARMAEPLGRCCIFPLDGDEKYVTVVDVCVVRLGTSPIDPRFMMYTINSPRTRANIETLSSGSTRKRVSRGNLARVAVPLAPLLEQRRIVAKIEELFSELDKGIESLKTARRQLEVYRQSVLKHAFEGKLTAQWREENKDKLETPEQLLARIKKERAAHYERQLQEWKANANKGERTIRRSLASRPAKLKDVARLSLEETETLPPLPGGWSYVRLGLVIDEPKYGTSKKCDYNFEGTGVLRIPNVVRGLIDDADLKGACFEDDEKWAYSLRSGDILIIRSNGSISIVGKCALVSSAEQRYLYAGYLIRIRHNPAVVLPEYLAVLISSHLVRVQIEGFAKSTSGVNNINSGEIQSLIVPLCSVQEQQEVVVQLSAMMSGMDATTTEIDEQLRTTDTLRQAVLKKAFAGQLVAQDPGDEPASVLLEKIRTESAKAGKSGPTIRRNRKAKTAA